MKKADPQVGFFCNLAEAVGVILHYEKSDKSVRNAPKNAPKILGCYLPPDPIESCAEVCQIHNAPP
jgi:hypothetical protein